MFLNKNHNKTIILVKRGQKEPFFFAQNRDFEAPRPIILPWNVHDPRFFENGEIFNKPIEISIKIKICHIKYIKKQGGVKKNDSKIRKNN